MEETGCEIICGAPTTHAVDDDDGDDKRFEMKFYEYSTHDNNKKVRSLTKRYLNS